MIETCEQNLGSDINLLPFPLGEIFPTNIYAISCCGYVKFGFARDVKARLKALATSNPFPLKLEASVAADARLERAIHLHLCKFWVRGEWFVFSPEVEGVIKMIESGQIAAALSELMDGAPSVPDQHVAWASKALQEIAGQRDLSESKQQVIKRVATAVGFPYWRTFDLWYGKARRLETSERDAIAAQLASAAA